MIFAIADYFCYRLQWGRYSREALESAGYRLATHRNFVGDAAPLPGDPFVMHTRPSTASWLIMYVQQDPSSHVGTMANDGDVIDATTAGVIRHPFVDYLDGTSYILTNRTAFGMTDEQRVAAVAFLESQVGKPFGWGKIIGIGLATILGSNRFVKPHWRLWADVLLGTCLISVPRLRWKWWPNLAAWVGLPYAVLITLRAVQRGSGYNRARPAPGYATRERGPGFDVGPKPESPI